MSYFSGGISLKKNAAATLSFKKIVTLPTNRMPVKADLISENLH